MSYLSLAAFGGVMFVVACSGAYFKPGDWYESLAKPSWTPPNWLFPVGWTLLYIMIAVAGWRVWEITGGAWRDPAFLVYGAQLVLNFAWSGLFFGMRRMDLAMVDVSLMWLLIALNIYLFMQIDALSAWLLVPYLAWVTFAAALNLSVWRLNPNAGS